MHYVMPVNICACIFVGTGKNLVNFTHNIHIYIFIFIGNLFNCKNYCTQHPFKVEFISTKINSEFCRAANTFTIKREELNDFYITPHLINCIIFLIITRTRYIYYFDSGNRHFRDPANPCFRQVVIP